MRADSQALAASTTMCARIRSSRSVALSMYTTPSARPAALVVTSRTIAPVLSVSFPVASAGRISTLGDVKFALMAHPREHWPQ